MTPLAPVLVAASLAATAPSPAPDAGGLVRGQRLFEGSDALKGRIAGHTEDLPPKASRCVNCHRAGAGSGGASAPASFAPRLTAESLTQPARRRSGPPSRYDLPGFCRMLRTGVDPAFVTMPAVMPRYDVTDADCRALWTYLTRPGR